jgi:hypothetical protein
MLTFLEPLWARKETSHGPVPIELITTDDWVLTRQGYRRVLASRLTQRVAQVLTIETTQGTLTGTPDHLVWTENSDDLIAGVIQCFMRKLPRRS